MGIFQKETTAADKAAAAERVSEEDIKAYEVEQAVRWEAQRREGELFHAAVQAMNGLVSAGSDRGIKGIVQHAFALAEEMLAERDRRRGPQ